MSGAIRYESGQDLQRDDPAPPGEPGGGRSPAGGPVPVVGRDRSGGGGRLAARAAGRGGGGVGGEMSVPLETMEP